MQRSVSFINYVKNPPKRLPKSNSSFVDKFIKKIQTADGIIVGCSCKISADKKHGNTRKGALK